MAKEEETRSEDKRSRDIKDSESAEDRKDKGTGAAEKTDGEEPGDDEAEDEAEDPGEKSPVKAKSKEEAAEADDQESDEDDDGDEADGHEDEDEDEDDAKPASKSEAKSSKPGRPVSPGRARPRPLRAPPPPPPPATNLGARVIVFVIVLGVLSVGFWALSGFDSGLDKPAITWRVGQVVEMDITLVKEDATNLACSSSQTIAGKKCEFAPKNEKNPDLTDATMLKPYTTTDGVNFVAAGLWTQPAISKGKLPNERFSIHCKYKVEGMLKTPLIRWNPSAAWGEKKEDWYAGTVSDCKLNPP